MLKLLHSVPSAPQNVTDELLNAITVRLHWDPPENPNGVITGYQVIYYGYRATVQVQQVLTIIKKKIFTRLIISLIK